jgi:hypothetical protein
VIRLERPSKRSFSPKRINSPSQRADAPGLSGESYQRSRKCGRRLGSLMEFLRTGLIGFSSFTSGLACTVAMPLGFDERRISVPAPPPAGLHKRVHLIGGLDHTKGYEGMHSSPLMALPSAPRPTTYRDRSISRTELRAVTAPRRPTVCYSRQPTEVSSTRHPSLLRSAAHRPQAHRCPQLGGAFVAGAHGSGLSGGSRRGVLW